MKKLIPLVIIGAGLAYFYNQFNVFRTNLQVQFGTISFNLKETQRNLFAKIILNLNLIIKNPSRITGKITGGKLDVIVNGKIVGSVLNIGGTTINAGVDTIAPLQIAINTLAIFPTVSDLIKMVGKGGSQTLQVTGNLLTSFGEIKINEKINFTI